MVIYEQPAYCPRCAAPLMKISIEKRDRLCCPSCPYIYWGDYSLGVGGILLRGREVLLVQRAHNPGRGRWTLPGGYVETDEQIEAAAAREIFEETGLLSEPLSLLGVRDRPGDFPGARHDLYLVFLMRQTGGVLSPDREEVSQAAFLTLDECRRRDVAPLSLHLIEKALSWSGSDAVLPGFEPQKGVSMTGTLTRLYSFI